MQPAYVLGAPEQAGRLVADAGPDWSVHRQQFAVHAAQFGAGVGTESIA